MKRPPAPAESILEAVGSTPLIRLRRITRGIRTPVFGKAENLNPGGLGEGPDRPGDDRGGGEARRAQARRSGGGGHQREHRHRPGHRRGDQGLPVHLHDPRQDVEREDQPAAGLRGGGGRGPHRGAPRPPGVLHHEGPQHRGGHPGRHLRQPALQPGQPRRPTTARRARRSGSRPRGGSPTSSARRAPAGPSPASGATSRSRTRRCRSSPATRWARSTRSTAGPGRRARGAPTRSRASAGTRSRPRWTSTWWTTG